MSTVTVIHRDKTDVVTAPAAPLKWQRREGWPGVGPRTEVGAEGTAGQS